MNKIGVLYILTASMLLSACGAGFSGPPRLARLSHIDGSVDGGKFDCRDGVLTAPPFGPGSLGANNLTHNFSSRVCASLHDPDDDTKTVAMLDSGVTLVKVRCNDFFNAKQTNQGRARFMRSLIQPLTVAITGTFSVIRFGSERGESDALALLAVGNSAVNAGIDVYEDQFLFGADNVFAVRNMTLRALVAHQDSIRAAIEQDSITSFDGATRALLDHQNICTPGNILELVRASIDGGTFRARERPTTPAAAAQDESAILLAQPAVG